MPLFTYTTALPFPRDEVFAWFTRPGALVRLTPSFFGQVLQEPSDGINAGSTAAMGVSAPGGLGLWLGSAVGTVRGMLPDALAALRRVRPELRWDALHTELVPGVMFRDVMASGPLSSWSHRHSFEDGRAPGSTVMTDAIHYELPAVAPGAWVREKFEAELGRMFAFRERQLLADLAFHTSHAGPPLTVAVTGASGLIGAQLTALLGGGGHTVRRLVRRAPSSAGEIFWDPASGTLDPAALADCDVVINLAGHTIGGRFTAKNKDAMYRSRVQGTRLLAETLGRLAADGRPRSLVSGSAVGYYGASPHTGTAGATVTSRALTEEDPAGHDFLAQLCQDWEAACAPAAAAGVRVVTVRTGLVLSSGGGMLQRLLPLYLAGAGGPLGGDNWQSWIGIDDIAGIFAHAALTPSLYGPLNGVAPHPVTAEQFAHTLGEVLQRPARLTVPALGPELLLGKQGATELALASQRASAAKAVGSGYAFRHETLAVALRHIVGASAPELPAAG